MLTNYKPPETIRRFILSDAEVKAVVGPVGSAKTAGALMEMFRRAVEQAPDTSGVRPTRAVIVRNTLKQIKATVLPDIQAYFGDLCRYRPSDEKVVFDFPLSDGTRVRSEWLFIPIDTEDDIRRLLSLNLTFAFVEEFREVDFKIISSLRGRLGRFPRVNVTPTWKGLIMVSNPYSSGSEWHRALEVDKPEGWDFFRQPSGLSQEAENIENLPPDYYERLCEGASEGWIKVHVHGLNGDDKSGSAVFGDSFNQSFHVRSSIRHSSDRSYLIGLDMDRNPAAVVCQMDAFGRLLVLREVFAEGMGLEAFVTTKLTPLMYEGFPGRAFVVADPSGVRRSSITEESSMQALARLGYEAVPAPTNSIDPRLRAVEERLNTQIGGGGALLIDRAGCPTLIRAMAMEYRYPRSKRGELGLHPEKRHPWSDLCLHGDTPLDDGTGRRVRDLEPGDALGDGKGGTTTVVATARRIVPLVEVELSDGRAVRCTPDHLVFLDGHEYPIRVDCLRSGDILKADCAWRPPREISSSACVRAAARITRFLAGGWRKAEGFLAACRARAAANVASRGSFWTDDGSAWTPATVTIGASSRTTTVLPAQFHSTATYGRKPTGQCQKDSSFITSIETGRARTHHGSNSWKPLSTHGSTPQSASRPELSAEHGPTSIAPAAPERRSCAKNAAQNTNASLGATLATPSARTCVVSVRPHGSGEVVSLQVDGGVYAAAGLLHHNCDALQYACLGASMTRRGRHIGRVMGGQASRQSAIRPARISPLAWT